MKLPKRRAAAKRERGAALVEAAIVIPLLATLAFGALEYGLTISSAHALKNGVRAGVRNAVASTTVQTDDYDTLQALKNSLGRVDPSTIEKVVIYKATATNGDVPDPCKTGSSSALSCNYYTGADLNASAGTIASKEGAWAPTSRAAGSDYLGIWVQAKKPFITGMFGSSIEIRDNNVMLIEPLNPDAIPFQPKAYTGWGGVGTADNGSGNTTGPGAT